MRIKERIIESLENAKYKELAFYEDFVNHHFNSTLNYFDDIIESIIEENYISIYYVDLLNWVKENHITFDLNKVYDEYEPTKNIFEDIRNMQRIYWREEIEKEIDKIKINIFIDSIIDFLDRKEMEISKAKAWRKIELVINSIIENIKYSCYVDMNEYEKYYDLISDENIIDTFKYEYNFAKVPVSCK